MGRLLREECVEGGEKKDAVGKCHGMFFKSLNVLLIQE